MENIEIEKGVSPEVFEQVEMLKAELKEIVDVLGEINEVSDAAIRLKCLKVVEDDICTMSANYYINEAEKLFQYIKNGKTA
mgnify:FL=1